MNHTKNLIIFTNINISKENANIFVGDMDMELLKNHVLVFVCSLIPKALASAFTSFIYTARYWRKDLGKVCGYFIIDVYK